MFTTQELETIRKSTESELIARPLKEITLEDYEHQLGQMFPERWEKARAVSMFYLEPWNDQVTLWYAKLGERAFAFFHRINTSSGTIAQRVISYIQKKPERPSTLTPIWS